VARNDARSYRRHNSLKIKQSETIVIGTRFGGAVAATRLAALGKQTLLIERETWWITAEVLGSLVTPKANPSKLEVDRESDLTRRGEGGWRAESRKGSRARTVEWIEADGVRVVEQIEEFDDEIEPPGPARAVRGEAAERDVLDHPEVDGEEGRRAKGVTGESERSSS
jgi:choline dehydrogenase-like flavoprotein